MDFNQVRYFLALAETLNFSHAAERCYVSQPALTQAIRRLEEELGGELINRSGRSTELTKLGSLLLNQFEKIDYARNIVRETAKAVTAGEIAELHIGVMCTIGPRALSRLLDEFQKQHPMISLKLHDVAECSITKKLLSGELNGVFYAYHQSPPAQLNSIHLFEEKMVIAFPRGHRFEEMSVIPLREITTQRYVDRLLCEFRDEYSTIFKKEGLQLDIAFSSEREDWIQSMVRDGVGVCVIPQFSLLQPELDHRPIKDPVLSRQVEFAFVEQPKKFPALDRLIQKVTTHNWHMPV